MKTLNIITAIMLSSGISSAQPVAIEAKENPYYSFSDDGMECIVHKSHLPRPWLNRLSNDVFFTWVTHNGYIESYLLDPNLNGLVNPQTVSGHFFVRDNQTHDYFLMNESDDNDRWHSTIGLGYNTLYKKKNELESELIYFIPRDENVLLAIVQVKNLSGRPREISLFGQVEWNLGDQVKTITYETNGVGGSQHNLYKTVYVEDNVMYGKHNNWRRTATCIPWPYTGYFTASESIRSYETSRSNFMGPTGTWQDPDAVVNGICSNTDFMNYDEYPLGVLHINVSLEPGETREVVFMLGMEKERDEINRVIQKYQDVATVKSALETVKEYYASFLDNTITIETPNKRNDRIINIWSKYHWRQGLKKELDSDTHGSGLWAYGLEGDRASFHPEYSMIPLDAGIIKKAIRNILLKNQSPGTEGSNLVSYPYAMLDSEIMAEWPPRNIMGRFEIPHHHQIYVFLFSIYYYLVETADLNFLSEVVPYIDGTEATVFTHIETAIALSTKVLNDRGLALKWLWDFYTGILGKGHERAENMAATALEEVAELKKQPQEEQDRTKTMCDGSKRRF